MSLFVLISELEKEMRIKKTIEIKLKALHPCAVIPEYQTAGSAGFDLCSVVEMVIKPKEWALVKTGIALEIPSGFEVQIRPRSGLALKHGISVLNSPGTIDSDYRGEIGVVLINHSKQEFKIEIGDRIAQGVVAEVIQGDFALSQELSQTLRNDGGFGSSGINKEKK